MTVPVANLTRPTSVPRLTVAECAERARLARITIYRALEGGALHGAQRIKGGRWTVQPGCLDAWTEGAQCLHQTAAVVVDLPARQAAS